MSALAELLRSASAAESKQRVDAERRGLAYLLYRDAERAQRIHELAAEAQVVTLGRQAASDLALPWDDEVSRVHARFERVGDEWTLVDDGSSTNGTFLNDARLHGRRRLHDGDVVGVGRTLILFRAATAQGAASTTPSIRAAAPTLSAAQRRVLEALCRSATADGLGVPASNPQIADELVVSVQTVKTHMRELFQLFGIGELPQNQKRAELVRQALLRRAVPPVRE